MKQDTIYQQRKTTANKTQRKKQRSKDKTPKQAPARKKNTHKEQTAIKVHQNTRENNATKNSTTPHPNRKKHITYMQQRQTTNEQHQHGKHIIIHHQSSSTAYWSSTVSLSIAVKQNTALITTVIRPITNHQPPSWTPSPSSWFLFFWRRPILETSDTALYTPYVLSINDWQVSRMRIHQPVAAAQSTLSDALTPAVAQEM